MDMTALVPGVRRRLPADAALHARQLQRFQGQDRIDCRTPLKQQRKHTYGTSLVTIHVSDVVPLSDHVGPVDPAPLDWDRAGRRLDPAGLVAGCRSCRRGCVRNYSRLPWFADWIAAAVRL